MDGCLMSKTCQKLFRLHQSCILTIKCWDESKDVSCSELFQKRVRPLVRQRQNFCRVWNIHSMKHHDPQSRPEQASRLCIHAPQNLWKSKSQAPKSCVCPDDQVPVQPKSWVDTPEKEVFKGGWCAPSCMAFGSWCHSAGSLPSFSMRVLKSAFQSCPKMKLVLEWGCCRTRSGREGWLRTMC